MRNTFLSTLANPVRLKMIRCLASERKSVSQLIGNCGLSQSAVSQHLARLKNAGLVVATRRGKEIYYELKNRKVAELAAQFEAFAEQIDD